MPCVEQPALNIHTFTEPAQARYAERVFDALYDAGIAVEGKHFVSLGEEVLVDVVVQLQPDSADGFFIDEVFECALAHRLAVQLPNGP